MDNKHSVNPSDEALPEQLAQAVKRARILKRCGTWLMLIGLLEVFSNMVLKLYAPCLFFAAVFLAGVVCRHLGVRTQRNVEARMTEQLQDFLRAELERVLGPAADSPEMRIDRPFLEEIRPVDPHWNRCAVWYAYAGCARGVRFSAANATLQELQQVDEANGAQAAAKTVFRGAVLRCRDLCDPALDLALRRPWADHHKDNITDPAVFRQHISARTADGRPADDLVTPQQRELIRRLESLDDNFAVTALIFRGGEVTLAMSGYTFADGLPSVGTPPQTPSEIRGRFTASLTVMDNLIGILREYTAARQD